MIFLAVEKGNLEFYYQQDNNRRIENETSCYLNTEEIMKLLLEKQKAY